MLSINVIHLINEQTIADLMTTALEGGCNYWVSRVVPVYNTHKDYSQPECYHSKMRPRVFIVDEQPYELDWGAIHRGLSVMATNFPAHFADIISDNEDAITGDVFLQCCLFGDVVYA